MIINLGISPNFGAIDFEDLTFPTVMSIDYVRVYQRPEDVNTGCDPDKFPHADVHQQVGFADCLLLFDRWLISFPPSLSTLFFAPDQVPRLLHKSELHNVGE